MRGFSKKITIHPDGTTHTITHEFEDPSLYNLGLNDDDEERKDNMIQDNELDSIFDNPIR